MNELTLIQKRDTGVEILRAGSLATLLKEFTYPESTPLPLGLLLCFDIHIPQDRFLVLIKRTRERVAPWIDHAGSLPTTFVLAIKHIKEGDGEGAEKERDKDR